VAGVLRLKSVLDVDLLDFGEKLSGSKSGLHLRAEDIVC